MTDLPAGWTRARLGELITLNPKNSANPGVESGFMPMNLLGTGYRSRPTFEVRPWGDIAKTYVHFADGDVLLAKITPCFENGKAGIATGLPSGIGAGSSEFFVCRPKGELLLPQFLLGYFKTNVFLREGALRMTGSVGHKRVPKDYLLESEVPLPPLAEQKRIADKLDTLLARIDACRERLERLPALIKRYRQAVLTAATTGSLTEEWREERGKNLGDWQTEKATDVCSKVQSGGTPKGGFTAQSGVPFLKVYNIVEQQVDFASRPQFVTPAVHGGELRKSAALPGDVLMNIVGPPLGKVAVVPDAFPEWNLNQAITLFRPGPRITSRWLYYVLCEGANVEAVMPKTRGSVGQVNISLSQCRAFTIPIPPADEQAEIVRRTEQLLALADRLEKRLETALSAAGRLTAAALGKAFRGELVPQDPSDEPASDLLERLRTASADVASAPRMRKKRPATALAP